jgi:hypothetical protein
MKEEVTHEKILRYSNNVLVICAGRVVSEDKIFVNSMYFGEGFAT